MLASPTTHAKSPWWLALRVVDEPTTVFSELRARPTAWVPVVLLLATTVGTTLTIPAAVLVNAAEQQLTILERKRPGTVTPELRERVRARASSGFGRAQAAAASAVGYLFTLTLVAGVLTLVFNALSGGGIAFKEEWAFAAHSYLPQIVGILIVWAGMSLTRDRQFQIGLGFLVSEDTSPFLHSFAAQFTFFGAWNVYLLSLANQIRTRDPSIALPLGTVAGLWISANLALAGVATALRGMMS